MTALNTLHAAGITDRQIDVWTSNRWVRPRTKGRGSPRVWPAEEVRVALLMKLLFDAGFVAARAAGIAREAQAAQDEFPSLSVTVDLGDGLTITIAPATQEAAA